uniref:Uncharacterized protein n=1 Tax=Panagrolaimus sp. ES5 TaxID=591445 RepID=A0AC34F3R7_9BILA
MPISSSTIIAEDNLSFASTKSAESVAVSNNVFNAVGEDDKSLTDPESDNTKIASKNPPPPFAAYQAITLQNPEIRKLFIMLREILKI